MKQIIFSALYILSLYLISTFIFNPTYLYYEIWWLDIPMHILGGAGFASLAIALLNYKHKKVTYRKIILFVLMIALLWESYEYFYLYLYKGGEWNGILDTVKDVFDGLLGGTLAYFIYKK